MTVLINGYEYENVARISFDTGDTPDENIWVWLTYIDGSYDSVRANYFLMDTVVIYNS